MAWEFFWGYLVGTATASVIWAWQMRRLVQRVAKGLLEGRDA